MSELYHHGVKGMKWGVRRKQKSIVSDKPQGRRPGWERPKTEREKRRIDDHGFNPNRPNGTSTRKKIKVNTEKESIKRMIQALEAHEKAMKMSKVYSSTARTVGNEYASNMLRDIGNIRVSSISASSGYDFWRS